MYNLYSFESFLSQFRVDYQCSVLTSGLYEGRKDLTNNCKKPSSTTCGCILHMEEYHTDLCKSHTLCHCGKSTDGLGLEYPVTEFLGGSGSKARIGEPVTL